jgi:Zn-dependent peptidase ImmA (M78 family)
MSPRPLSSIALSALEAGRLLHRLDLDRTQQIPVYQVAESQGLSVLFRPMDKVFGAYIPINGGAGGILMNSKLPRALQRFTAGHELGHCFMKHAATIDPEQNVESPNTVLEKEADAFAEHLLMPHELVSTGMGRIERRRQHLDVSSVYQLSLDMGVSYRATVKRLSTLHLISPFERGQLMRQQPKQAKADLLPPGVADDYRRDVFLLTPNDPRSELHAREGDIIAVQLEEQASSGYIWEIDAGESTKILADSSAFPQDRFGAACSRQLLLAVERAGDFNLSMRLSRPWSPETTVRERTVLVHAERAQLGLLAHIV